MGNDGVPMLSRLAGWVVVGGVAVLALAATFDAVSYKQLTLPTTSRV
jgi:hypothetical protein